MSKTKLKKVFRKKSDNEEDEEVDSSIEQTRFIILRYLNVFAYK